MARSKHPACETQFWNDWTQIKPLAVSGTPLVTCLSPRTFKSRAARPGCAVGCAACQHRGRSVYRRQLRSLALLTCNGVWPSSLSGSPPTRPAYSIGIHRTDRSLVAVTQAPPTSRPLCLFAIRPLRTLPHTLRTWHVHVGTDAGNVRWRGPTFPLQRAFTTVSLGWRHDGEAAQVLGRARVESWRVFAAGGSAAHGPGYWPCQLPTRRRPGRQLEGHKPEVGVTCRGPVAVAALAGGHQPGG